jgi:hypothetical protein
VTEVSGRVVAGSQTDTEPVVKFNVVRRSIGKWRTDVPVRKDVMGEPLARRRELLETRVLPKLPEPVRYSHELKASLRDLIESAKALALEGLVAKRRDSKYEPGLRSGAWQKMRVSQGQEFVVAGYTPSPKKLRCAGNRLLRWCAADVCGAHPERIHTCITHRAVQEDETHGNRGVSVREST